MIKNIVFDIGNVLISFKPIDYLSKKFKDQELVKRLYDSIFCSGEWPLLDLDDITEEDAFLRFCTRYPGDREAIMDVFKDWYSLLTPIEGTIEILKEVKQKGYKTYVLSNYHSKAFERVSKENSFFELFDGMVVSSKVKHLKPDSKIFYCLMDSYGIVPEETLFIDDTVENTEAAIKLGFNAINFSSPLQLLDELMKYNILQPDRI